MSVFPTNLDTFTTKSNGDTLQSTHVNDLQDAVSALEAKVGVDGSSVATSLTKKVADLQAAATVLQGLTLAPVLGYATSPKASGAQSITGIGFRPRTIIMICTSDATEPWCNKTCIGFHCNANQNYSFLVDTKELNASFCTVFVKNTNGYEYQAIGSVQSMDADGFTLSWQMPSNMAKAIKFIYLALP